MKYIQGPYSGLKELCTSFQFKQTVVLTVILFTILMLVGYGVSEAVERIHI